MPLQEIIESVRAGKPSGDLVARLLGLDALNAEYFVTLLQRFLTRSARPKMRLAEMGEAPGVAGVAHATAVAAPELLRHISWVEYASLEARRETLSQAATQSFLWIKKMQAGTGSSIRRSAYLALALKVPETEVKLGAKGTDLFFAHLGAKRRVSLAEAQILQALLVGQSRVYAGVFLQDSVSLDTQASVEAIWNSPSVEDPGKSYAWVVGARRHVARWETLCQAALPTIDSQGQLSRNRSAPGGHALFGMDAVRCALNADRRPPTSGQDLVAVVANGEDLSAFPDPLMVGWMVTEKIPIAMITTEKTAIDRKGGQLALVTSAQGVPYVSLVEAAQAKEAGQLEYFEKLGLDIQRPGQVALFNTNMALFNYAALVPCMERLKDAIGEEKLLAALGPDLICNVKEQQDADGVRRAYTQLEGAMGSALLNLDRCWREQFHEPLVHFINIDSGRRTQFFSPIKTAFDFFIQFHSDRFDLDLSTMKLVDRRPGHLPSVLLDGDRYQEVQVILDAFAGTSVLGLDALTVHGDVSLAGCVLRGRVSVRNESGAQILFGPRLAKIADWPKDQGRVLIENRALHVDKSGEITFN